MGASHAQNKKRMGLCAKKQTTSFSTVYINRLLKIAYVEKYAETTIRPACQKTFTDHKTGKRFVFLVSSYYVFHNGHEHHLIKKLSFITNCLNRVCSNVLLFFFVFVLFSKPVTLCLSDLFKEIDTYDRKRVRLACKRPRVRSPGPAHSFFETWS